MAGNGLLARIMRSPELMAMLGIGGAGALLSEGDDKLGNGVAGAALGLAAGRGIRGVRGLLSRVPVSTMSQAEKVAKTLELRRALGQTGSQATQFPNAQAMSAIDDLGEGHAMNKYGAQIGMNGVDKAIDGLKEVGRLGSAAWDGVDDAFGRAMPRDLIQGVKDKVGNNAGWLVGGGIIGGLGAFGYGLARALSGEDGQDDEVRSKAMQAIGFENTPTGIRMFQAQVGVPLTGEWDDQTIQAISKMVEEKMKTQRRGDGPPAPSLAPHNQR
jgi:hypothetical protein